MKRTTTIVLAAAIAVSMTACTALDSILGFNLFAGLAAVDESDIKDANASELIDLSSSDSFYDTLADKPELKAEVLEKIDLGLVSADPLSADYQELAFLAATIELQTTPAGELVNNVSGLFDSLISGDTPTDDLGLLIEGLLPDSVIASDGSINEAEFIDMINGLVEADDYFVLLGDSLEPDPDTGEYDYADGVDFTAGDVAQAAIVSSLVASITVPGGYDTTGDYLYALLNDEVPDPDSDSFDVPEFDSPEFALTPLGKLLLAANLDFSSDDSGI